MVLIYAYRPFEFSIEKNRKENKENELQVYFEGVSTVSLPFIMSQGIFILYFAIHLGLFSLGLKMYFTIQ